MKRCLVIGYGSIGKRHAEILSNLQHSVSLVTSQQTERFPTYFSIPAALAKHTFDYIVIANATHLHCATLCELVECGYHGAILIEKPLFSVPATFIFDESIKVYVAYNLRFSQPLQMLKKLVANEKLISFSVNVGQYLPDWRQERDYRESYSAKKALGGGVLADLSHELDYATWICGKTLEVSARGGHFSELEIDSDDIYSILMRCEQCPIVNIQLNYLDRVKRRDIIIHTQKHSIVIDLVRGSLSIDGTLLVISSDLSDSYIKQHEAIMKNDVSQVCSYEAGMDTVKLMQIISEANIARQWIGMEA